jgi:hypothetical protein
VRHRCRSPEPARLPDDSHQPPPSTLRRCSLFIYTAPPLVVRSAITGIDTSGIDGGRHRGEHWDGGLGTGRPWGITQWPDRARCERPLEVGWERGATRELESGTWAVPTGRDRRQWTRLQAEGRACGVVLEYVNEAPGNPGPVVSVITPESEPVRSWLALRPTSPVRRTQTAAAHPLRIALPPSTDDHLRLSVAGRYFVLAAKWRLNSAIGPERPPPPSLPLALRHSWC